MPHAYALAFAVGAITAAVAVALMTRAATRRKLSEATDRVRTETLEHARDTHAAERIADVGSMTAGLAHEIKNPLSTIGLNAQLLREAVEDLPTDRPADAADRTTLTRRVEGLAREADRLSGILSDFLEYAGELHIHTTPTDLNALAEELGDFYRPQAEQSGVRLRIEPAPTAAVAPIDPAHVKQAALNLMLNATQAMTNRDKPGEPNAANSKAELILRVVRTSDHVALHIIDTGPGIPADAIERIFTPYFTTKAGGSGLGLPTTRRIAEAHTGRVELHTDPNKGTDFALIFPA
ncbi:MAG: ATP-binding protein [Planctomycetota bacterium]